MSTIRILNYDNERAKLVEDWAYYTILRLQKSLGKKKVGVTGSLKASLYYDLVSIAGEISSVKHHFNYYGKFVDMGVGYGQKLSDVKGNRDAYQARKPKVWFSKTYYSEIMQLTELLTEKYGEQVTMTIKEEIETLFAA